ncbi:hypothetical protein SAMN05444156_1677 [Verrucomicrobium sp. GAS474]|uniref:hypothetical protein n=1 Tax=Verrucomicrobium sp. GAS474 TaxID=1882831 RepID=UPI00087B6E9F|nr:hypothetical protein [Verrucomicrobium sp. GAS474]SDU05154.1 hypothetical protein SAMN05444156_1677 [Verrucomicrobium sp. GAS474]
MNRSLAFLGLALAFVVVLPLRADEKAEVLVHKMVERDKELERHRAAYFYTVKETRQKLDGEGKVVDSSVETVTLRGTESSDHGTAKKMEIEAGAEQAAHEEPFSILKIVDHYQYTLEGDEVIDGVPCYKVRFSPKKDQPFRNREEKVANGLAGYLWFAKSDYTLIRNEGKLLQPVSVAWFFATLREVDFLFKAAPLPNGEWGPALIQYRFRVQIPLSEIHERHIRVMKDYRKAR